MNNLFYTHRTVSKMPRCTVFVLTNDVSRDTKYGLEERMREAEKIIKRETYRELKEVKWERKIRMKLRMSCLVKLWGWSLRQTCQRSWHAS